MEVNNKTVTKQGWVRTGNLQSFVLILSHLSAYKFSTYDWDSVVAGLRETSSDDNLWFYYKFGDKRTIAVKLARDTDESGIIIYNVVAPAALAAHLDLALYILDEFHLLPQDAPGTIR